jgi:hypothetical protein
LAIRDLDCREYRVEEILAAALQWEVWSEEFPELGEPAGADPEEGRVAAELAQLSPARVVLAVAGGAVVGGD